VRARRLTETALTVAMALILAALPLYRMPQGGSVSLVMLPIMGLALVRGTWVGIGAGFLFGILHALLQSPFLYHPLQIALDYPLAYGALGLAGLPRDLGRRGIAADLLGCLLGWTARLVCHLLSGWVYFRTAAPDPSRLQEWFSNYPWLLALPGADWPNLLPAIFVLAYNLIYMLPSGLVTVLVLFPVLGRLRKVLGSGN